MAFAVRSAARPALASRRSAAAAAPRRASVVRAEGENTPAVPAETPAVVQAVSAPTPAAPMPVAAPVAVKAPTIAEAMAFKAEPEIINGRLCMLAFVAAVGAELATGEPVLQQFKDQPVLVVVAAALFAWASLVPVLLGKKSDSTTLGPFRPSAELLNGRAAMLGFASLLAVEGFKHTALF